MQEEAIAARLMRLYGRLRETGEEHAQRGIRIEIDRLLAQLEDAARAVEPAAHPDAAEPPHAEL